MRNANILLSVGLPLTRFGAEKLDYWHYAHWRFCTEWSWVHHNQGRL